MSYGDRERLARIEQGLFSSTRERNAGKLASSSGDSGEPASETGDVLCRMSCSSPLVKAFLETGHMDVEAEDFGREGVLGGKLFGPPDALLPGSFGHRAIMGLRLGASNCRVACTSQRFIVTRRYPGLTVARSGTIFLGKFVGLRLGF